MQLTRNPYDLKLKLICKENIGRLVEYYKKGFCFPIEMEVNPTNICNLNCSWCISKQYHRNELLKIDTLKTFLRAFKKLGGKSIIWSGGGEPTCHPDFVTAVNESDKLGIEQGLMTNGFFSDKILQVVGNTMKWIRISLDTLNRYKYKQMKGVDVLEKVIENIKISSNYSAKLVVNMNVSKINENEIFDVALKARQLGADGFQLRPVLPTLYHKTIYIPPNMEDTIETLNNLNTARFVSHVSYDKFEEMLKPREYKSCTYHNFIGILNSNGDVSVCMYRLYEREFAFGNIYENSLDEIWNSQKRQEVIKHCKDMDFSKCQVCCKGHELNTFIHSLEITNNSQDRKFL